MKRWRVTLLILLLFIACGRTAQVPDLTKPAYKLASYAFVPGSGVKSRITRIPVFLLEHLKKMDGRSDYLAHDPDAELKALVMRYYDLLPTLNRKIIRERLVGIYFVDNFLGSGLADFIVDEHNRVYFYLVINTSVLKKSLTELVTYREKSCFIMNDPAWDIRVDCGRAYSGLMYILLHETTHCVDYALSITPYTDEGVRRIRESVPPDTDFTRGIWKSYDATAAPFAFRRDLTFYGMNGGPKIPVAGSPALYRDFSRSPFATLYGSQNWAEDLADYITFYHLAFKLGQGYSINVLREKNPVFRLEPFSSGTVKGRSGTIRAFYETGAGK